MATTTPTIEAKQILGAAIVELLTGELSDDTINAVDTINRADVPQAVRDVVGFMHGMTMQPNLRQSCVTSLLREIRGIATEELEKRLEHPNPFNGGWVTVYSLLEAALEGVDYDLRGTVDSAHEAGNQFGDVNQVPAWAKPLVEHINNSTTPNDGLSLELLDLLEAQIQKRRAELAK